MRAWNAPGDLSKRIRAMWDEGLDTREMQRALHIPEHEIERLLHATLDRRRAIVGCLGQKSDAS